MPSNDSVCEIPATVEEAARLLATGDAVIVGGGTDLMPLIAAGDLRPSRLLSLRRIPELRRSRLDGDQLIVGATVTYSELQGEPLAQRAPVLAAAARAVGSVQVRNLGTLGGALVTAAPTGDLLPALLVAEAMALCVGTGGAREVPVAELLGGDPGGRSAGGDAGARAGLVAGEFVVAARLRRPGGPGCYLRVARRGAVARAGLTLALVLDPGRREVRCAAGGLTPVPLRFPSVESWLADRVDWMYSRVADGVPEEFGLLVGDHALARAAESRWRPAGADDDEIAYLHRALVVTARRALRRVLS